MPIVSNQELEITTPLITPWSLSVLSTISDCLIQMLSSKDNTYYPKSKKPDEQTDVIAATSGVPLREASPDFELMTATKLKLYKNKTKRTDGRLRTNVKD